MLTFIKNWLHRKDKTPAKVPEVLPILDEMPKEDKTACNCETCNCKDSCTPRPARKLSDEIPPAKNPRIKRG